MSVRDVRASLYAGALYLFVVLAVWAFDVVDEATLNACNMQRIERGESPCE